jgi:hypothetical protein
MTSSFSKISISCKKKLYKGEFSNDWKKIIQSYSTEGVPVPMMSSTK